MYIHAHFWERFGKEMGMIWEQFGKILKQQKKAFHPSRTESPKNMKLLT
jgi:hypothetical protein